MIIQCINCDKNFEVNSDLIPSKGRLIQCGSCGHVWFFKKNSEKESIINEEKEEFYNENLKIKKENKIIDQLDTSKQTKKRALVKYQKKTSYNLSKFVRHIFVLILSFLALIIFLDTLKVPLSSIFPDLELLLFNLYELVIDISLFIKDLI
jgi:predicted Zn finger-like uncharacterized protein